MPEPLELELEVPLETAVALFDNEDNLKKWQPHLISVEHLSGRPGQPGAKTMLKYKMGGREIEMLETLVEHDLPDKFAGIYETAGLSTAMEHRFHKIDDRRTMWTVTADPTPSTFFMKLMSWLMPGMCAKETLKFMRQFKDFAESEYAGRLS